MTQSFVSKSPTRVDLAGGTLDLWPIYAFLNGACTVNMAIDIWTEAKLTPHKNKKIHLLSRDMGWDMSFSSIAEFLKSSDSRLSLYQPLLDFFISQRNDLPGFTLETFSQSPVGGGLGGSSSLMVSLIKVFNKWLTVDMSISQIVKLASNLEAQLLFTPTGTQDYYPALSGGLNILNYNMDKVDQEVYHEHTEHLQDHLILVYTGKPHHSGLNNWSVLTGLIEEKNHDSEKKLNESIINSLLINSLKKLNDIAKQTANVCRSQEWDKLPELFNQESSYREKLSPSFLSPEIKKLFALSKKAGAKGAKICGAGGGGCVLIWAEAEKKQTISNTLESSGFTILNIKPTSTPQ